MKKIVILLTFLSLFFLCVQAQERINGIVTDAATNEPLVGATIVLKGTTQGTITDLDGKFNMEKPSNNQTLVVSYIGYKSSEISYTGQSSLSISLDENISGIDEVVVVGYGTQKKSHLTGAISKITNDNLEQVPVSRVDQALSGRIAGLTIQNTTSEVGVSPQIRVRGMGSISASNEPLVVIDGYPVPDGLSMIDMNDVQSVEVLKDASSAAIYGSRGANGVIIITTKSGEVAKPRFKFSYYTGWKDYIELHPMMDSEEFGSFRMQERALLGGVEPSLSLLSTYEKSLYLLGQELGVTDWQQEALRTARINNYSLRISGGVNGVKYYISGSYMNDEGLMKKSSYEKISINGKVEAKLSDRITVGMNFTPTYAKRQRPRANFTDYMRNPTFMPVFHNAKTSALTGYPEGTYAFGRHFRNIVMTDPETGQEFTASPWGTSNNSPAYIRENESYFSHYYRALTNSFANLTLAKGFEFRTSNGVYVNYTTNEIYNNAGSRRDGTSNSGEYTNGMFIDLLSENMLTYNKQKGDHMLDVLAGGTFQKTKIDNAYMEGSSFPTDYIHTLNAATVFDLEGTGTEKEETSLISYLARLNYSYQDKYLISLVTRTDGSSLFGPENKWGWFPSASLGWRVSEEPFFKIEPIDMLKFRASVGVTGNNDIQNYAHQNTLTATNYQLGVSAAQPTAGLGQANNILGNKAISWEQTLEYNYGFDLAMFDGRLDLIANYYYKVTDQLLLQQEINSYTGYNQYWNNIGKVRNKGIEIDLGGQLIDKKTLKWRLGFNLAANNNRLLELGGEGQTIKQGERTEQYIAIVGEPSIQYYGYKMIGVWASEEEIANNPHSNDDAPGGIRVADVNPDGKIDADDRTTLGDPFPDYNWGIVSELKFGSFDLSLLFEGVQGVDVFLGDGYYNETRRFNRNFTEDRWISAEHPGSIPFERNGRNLVFTDYLIDDGSYWCLRNINLGYQLPRNICKKLKIKSARVYSSVNNLIYVMASDFRGINPEARSTSSAYSDPLVDGYQRGAFPLERTVTFGLNLDF